MTSFRPFSHMRNGKKVLAAFGQVSSGALAAAAMAAVLPGSVAHAQAITPPATVNTGTASSSELTHKLSATYRVNSFARSVSNELKYVVGRIVDVRIAVAGGTRTWNSIPIGAKKQAIPLLVQNYSNATLDVELRSANFATGALARVGTGPATGVPNDSFDVTNIFYYQDNGNGIFDADDTPIQGFAENVPAGASRLVWYTFDVPTTATDGGIAVIGFSSVPYEPELVSGSRKAVSRVTDAGLGGVDTLFHEPAAFNSPANDGLYTTEDYVKAVFVVQPTNLIYTWYERVVSDVVQSTTPRRTPYSVVEICLAVTNPTADIVRGVTFEHDIPPQLTVEYTPDKSPFTVGGQAEVVVGGHICSQGTPGGTITKDSLGAITKVSGVIGDIPPNSTKSMYYNARVK